MRGARGAVVILESYFITGSYMGWTGGESIWSVHPLFALCSITDIFSNYRGRSVVCPLPCSVLLPPD